MKRIGLCALAVVCLVAAAARAADDNGLLSIENDALRVSLSPQEASLSVTDKRIGLVWRQQTTPGYQVVGSSVKQTPGSLAKTGLSGVERGKLGSNW